MPESDADHEILQKMGLTEAESRIYLALLENGPGTVSAIAKKSGLHRPTIYQYLPKLHERGLVTSFPKGKQKHFVAEPPKKLERLFADLTADFQTLLPDLEKTYAQGSKKPVIKFMEGRKGIMFVYEDVVRSLKKGDIFYRYSSVEDKKGENYLPPHYREIRDKKQLQRFVITNPATLKRKKPRLERALKIVPPEYDLFSYNIIQIIYGDKVAFLDYNTETALIIENPVIAEFQKKIFKLLYDKLG